MAKQYYAVFAIVNNGFSDTVMDAARAAGARGGTIINARGTSSKEIEKKYNILIHPEKELILILVDETVKDAVLHSIYKEVGFNSEGQGITFALPVDEVVGIVETNTN